MEPSMRKPITLIVDGDSASLSTLVKSLTELGHNAFGMSTLSEAARFLKERGIDLLLLDIRLSDGCGLDLLSELQRADGNIPAIVVTGSAEVTCKIHAKNRGVCEYILKPVDPDLLRETVQRVLAARRLRRGVGRLCEARLRRGGVPRMLGESPPMSELRELMSRVAKTDTLALLTGEPGTGKELVARGIHGLSPRSGGTLITVNCGQLTPSLLESVLFGHEAGVFTDARKARPGLFERAKGGTLFLDELRGMKPELQVSMLRVLDGYPFARLGGVREMEVEFRVIAATNGDLEAEVKSGALRKDLYDRLMAFPIRLPPLRDRGDDIPLLVRHFLDRACEALPRRPIRLAPEVEEALLAYDWPGNVRELRNVMERAAILCEMSDILLEHLPENVQAASCTSSRTEGTSGPVEDLAEAELRHIQSVLDSTGGNRSKTARILGISRNRLARKLRKLRRRRSAP